MGLLLVFFLISIVFSFLCSIWEAVLLSITPAHVEIKFQEGKRVGKLLKSYKTDIDRPLAAILTLNTAAHTAGAIGVGAQANIYWDQYSLLGMNVAAVIVPVVMTIAILILSEIIPKTLGANYWKQLTNFTVNSLSAIIFILYPLIWVTQLITKSLKKDKDKSVFERSDISAMASIGEQSGVIEQNESKVIQNLLRFDTIRSKDIMTPRTVVIAANENMTVRDFYEENKKLRFSRIPIFHESIDKVSGFILKDELLTQLVNENDNALLKDISREIQIVNEVTPLPQIFNILMEKREHIALVVDEFGGMAGIVSMEDIIETLLGLEIMDEFDNTADMQQLARKNWENRAKLLGLIINEEQKSENEK